MILSSGIVDWIKNNTTVFIGIVAAVVVIIMIIIILAVSLHKRRKSSSEDDAALDGVSDVSESAENETSADGALPATATEDETPALPSSEEYVAASAESGAEKQEPVQEAPAVTAKPRAAEKDVPKQRKATGRWTIEMKGEGEYMAKLSASNGEVMLSSEIYSSEDGARSGISTIIKGVESGQFVTYRDKSGNYYYKLKTANNRLLCVGEIYRAKDQCLRAVETVKRLAATAVISDELVEGEKYIKYVPVRVDENVRSARGKWRVEKTEDGKYCAKLFASNGQLMLATEEVSTRKSAENSILSVKRNAAEGNFIIDRDKFGRYYYKLRNSAKSVICIGEVYESLDSCIKAIESVRRFAATAVTGSAE